MNPFKFRPKAVADEQTVPDEWADNWLSNFMAWFSLTFLGPWCSTPDHWTSRLAGYMFTDCPCCIFFRGVFIGLGAGGICGLMIGILL